MRTRYAACLVRVCTLLALVLPVLPGHAAAAPPRQGPSSGLMVYHELALRPDGSLAIDSPVLSGDGRRAVWAESPLDLKASNRVFALDVDGGQPREIDAYTPLCECQTEVDVSNDGNTVVSTEGVRIRVLDSGVLDGGATLSRKRELIRLADVAISALRISGNGSIIVFTVSHDTTVSVPNPRTPGAPIPRGIWAVSAEGGVPLQLAGVREIAAVSGVPVAELEANSEFHSELFGVETHALDVSDDGRRIIFAARTGKAAAGVFSIIEGAPLSRLAGPMPSVSHVAVSGDGQTVAFATDAGSVSVLAGGTLKSLPAHSPRIDWQLQLSRDGSKLLARSLLGPSLLGSMLVEVATLATRQLMPRPPTSLEAEAFPRLFRGPAGSSPTMNAAGTRVLYVADYPAPNRGTLALIELGATDLGGAPLVRGLNLDPDTIPRDGSKGASVSTEISWDGTLIGAWLEIHREGVPDGVPDDTIGSGTRTGLVELRDTVGPDPRRLQGIFATELAYSTRRDEKPILGSRNLRLVIESQAADGRRHGTVFDADKTLTVGDPVTSGGVYRGTGGGQTINIEVGEDRTPAQLVIGSVTAEIVLEATANGHSITGGSLSYDVQRVYDNGVEKESFTSSKGYGALTSYPGGAWGEVLFTGPMTMQWENIEPQKYEEWDEGFDVALDSSGQLVLCPDTEDEPDPQAAVSRCLATGIVVLRPVVDEPPPSP